MLVYNDTMHAIDVTHIIPLNYFEEKFPIKINVVYAKPNHPNNHFPNLYHANADLLWAHRDIALITLEASRICYDLYGWTLELIDCLRPVEAQRNMEQYGYHPSLVSLPGSGAHPRAMAMDVIAFDAKGTKVNMGTEFDHFVDNPMQDNPAARHYTKFEGSVSLNALVWSNRQKLEFSMRYAATKHKLEIVPLLQEWWDFRFSEDIYEKFYPLEEKDLLPCQRLINLNIKEIEKILAGIIPSELQNSIDFVEQNIKP